VRENGEFKHMFGP